MATKLPRNILQYLATYFERQERGNCGLVCKQWKEPPLSTYWAKLVIDNTTIFTIIDEFRIKEACTKDAYRAWTLDINLGKYYPEYISLLQPTGLALESIFNKLSKLICLVHLTIYQMSSIEHGQNIFMTDIESLHRNLSHMHYIKIDASLQSIPEEEMERTRNVKSANKIKIIHFIYDNIGLLWISYFAHKYLNLVSFNVTPLKILG
ncbi:hypothetical protein J3Q64DRAFT_1702122 [Phycomyces blakesleeanus]|uniref:F-box domain-containing protein n=2 Tax=Phycomyces blakesleeanus TaxID=4837 RepID=A0A167RBZ2_PHYB8|nr:hypothetical protein PHYBLDRAFT_69812 [Phycomyces blakesleeanus NRRL 1555(-)]OAD81314.1 hypothetical protein PHYBLDRAFT_69812 [Phycomyces blakesleeanus NRRL 1555(-)]|eukprot:XP_018299354.1 hypothetical protein PHYBLDRAFT_69812 [Phycomyces blakesleeanus NRRL 1555(-)]